VQICENEVQAEASLRWVQSDGAAFNVHGKLVKPTIPINVTLSQIDLE
jgi:hypothetical protein